jgi:hypothetical protein
MNRLLLVFCAGLVLLSAGVAVAQADNAIGVVLNSGASNPFGGYLPEVLKAEGSAGAQTESLGGVTLAKLQSYGTIVLSETSLTAQQAGIFRQYVSGNEIGVHPDDSATSEGWCVQWETNPPGQ